MKLIFPNIGNMSVGKILTSKQYIYYVTKLRSGDQWINLYFTSNDLSVLYNTK